MGKKSAHSGESPKERSINKMDKFIARNERRNKHKELLPARRKDPNVPINLWPLKRSPFIAQNNVSFSHF